MLGYATVFLILGIILGTVSTILTWFMYRKVKETSTLSIHSVKKRCSIMSLIPLTILVLLIVYFVFILYFMKIW